MKLSEVPAYIFRRHGSSVTRMTVYNWVNAGKRGEKLHVVKKAGTRYTTEGWVDEFISRVP